MGKNEFERYRRTQIAEMIEWSEGFDMTGVSVSEVDRANGSPKKGDRIARNPKNHADKWLVAYEYFNDNFEVIDDSDIDLHKTDSHGFLPAISEDLIGAKFIHQGNGFTYEITGFVWNGDNDTWMLEHKREGCETKFVRTVANFFGYRMDGKARYIDAPKG